MKFFVETFGCQMNVADSEEMSRHLTKYGHLSTATKENADLLLLNTCTVRQHAEDKTLSFIGRLKDWKKKDPKRVLVVTGCAAERLKTRLKKRFPHIDLVVGAKDIEEFPKLLKPYLKNKETGFDWFGESESTFGQSNLRPGAKPLVLGHSENCAFVTVMRGCNYSCSYCIVPFVRGREVYRPIDTILNEVEESVSAGAEEVLLLGQTVNSYWYKGQTAEGREQLVDFADLISRVSQINGVRDIRFMSPHPHYMTDKLIRTISECKNVSPQIHLPVQSGSDKILKAMKRNYTREEYLAIALKLSRAVPNLQLTTDFIAGFPGESENDFQQTLTLMDEAPIRSAYCFKYSLRKGTESAQLEDDVPREIKEERLERLLDRVEKLKNEKDSLCFVA